MSRVAALSLVVTALAATGTGTIGTGQPTADEGRGARPAASLALAAGTTCPDLAVLGVDGTGSGWSEGTGPRATPLRVLTRALAADAVAAGSTVRTRHLGVAFAGASTLTPAGIPRHRASLSVTNARARAWSVGVGSAVTQLGDQLRSMALACPEQAFVLAGTAQGAAAAHRVLARTAADPALHGRIAGAALISDPDRSAGTRAQLTGTPSAWRSGAGVLTKVLVAQPDAPAATSDVRVVSFCTQGDIVCDLRGWSIQRSLAANATYGAASTQPALVATASRLWDRAAAWPRVVPADPIATHPGEDLTRKLGVRVGAPYAAGVVVDDVQGVPPGVSLGPDGRLTGSVASAGAWTVTYRLHNASPATSGAAGSLSIVSTSTGVYSGVDDGGQTTCRVTGTGTATCVGDGSQGQLGNGTTVDSTVPVQVGAADEWASMSTSGLTTCGVKIAGGLFCWGANNRGQLGIDGGRRIWPQRVGTDSDWQQVSAGWLHTCAVKATGALYCWGENSDGQLGLGTRTSRPAPVQVGTATDWTSVVTGGWHTCATRQDGSAWCWGRGDLGQLGTGDGGRRLAPAPVSSTARWSSLEATWSSTCGLTTDKQIQCWGVNGRGQLGDGTRVDRLAPVAVTGGHEWSAVAVGDEHTCGLDTSGAAWCWGANRYGQLGDGSQVDALQPVRVAGGGSWAAVDAGWLHSCGLALDDSVQCWGNNEHGQLGRGDRADRTTPPDVRVASPRRAVARVADPSQVVVTSFNILGSQHTEPGGGAKTYAPGRIRSEWATSLLQSLGSGIVGFQEIQPDQFLELKRSLGPRFAWYPGTTTDARKVWQSIVWDTAQWRRVDSKDVYVPFLGKTRPNSMVRLRNVQSGRDIWVLDVHNNSGNTADRQRQRDAAVKIELDTILTQRQQKVPVVFLGDMNERDRVFCTTTRRTDLEAVTGGSYVAGTCTPPRFMHLDWMFASPELPTRRAGFVDNAEVNRVTDHSLLSSTLGLPRS